MTTAKRFGVVAICVAGLGWCVYAQDDGVRFSSDLRAKYGAPLARETFRPRPEVEMVVDYAVNGEICRIQLPPVGPGREPQVMTTQAIDDLVLELVPLAARGKEVGRYSMQMGIQGESVIEYEKVLIATPFQGPGRTGVTVMFRRDVCQAPILQNGRP